MAYETFTAYETKVMPWALFPADLAYGDVQIYPYLGLGEEAGEVVGKAKKAIRDKQGVVDREAMLKELGDCLWYLAAIAKSLGSGLQEVAELNVAKLQSRHERGKVHGEGDNR